jgi:hypothetical protein
MNPKMKNKITMNKSIIILGIIACIVNGCSGQTKNKLTENKDNMIETFDFIEYEKRVHNDPVNGDRYTKSDGTLVEEINCANPVRWEMSPRPTFVKVLKQFYSNGNMKRKETHFGQHTRVDTSLYYDEKGNLIKTVDENKKFGKIKPEDILRFLESKKRINIETGEGVFDVDNHEMFKVIYNEKKNVWYITIWKGRPYTAIEMDEIMAKIDIGEPNDWKPFKYTIDGNTGEVISANE